MEGRPDMPKVMHIHFWADIRNSAGSVEKVITAFASHGQDYDHCIACCPGAGAPPQASFVHQGVQVHSFSENRVLNRIMNKMLARNAFTYGSLVRLINRLRPDVLHFHNRQELVDAVVRRLAYRPKVAVHYHRHFAEPAVPDSADLLLFISDATAAHILGKTGTRTPHRIVQNPLSLEVLAHARSASSASNAIPVILFGGGSNPIKGGRELIDAFLGLPRGAARLVMAGRGSDRFDVADPLVALPGEVTSTRFFELMREADIVAMPSYDEPFGLIAQEAMLMGKLFVTTASGGLAEFVDDTCAVIVRPRDVASLREGLARSLALLGKPEEAGRLTDNARARVAAFAPERVTATLEACYHDMEGART